MNQKRNKTSISAVALTCGAILLSSLNAPVANAAVQNDGTKEIASAQTETVNDKNREEAVEEGNSIAPTADSEAAEQEQNSAAGKEETTPVETSEDNEDDKETNIIDGLPQQTVIGELPDLAGNILDLSKWAELGFSPDYNMATQDVDLKWKTEPNVSEKGSTEGEAELTFPDYNVEGQPAKHLIVKIKVEVVEGQKKTDDQVRNRLTYIDKDTKEVIASYSWVGDKNDVEPAFSDDLSYIVDDTVKGLGYQVIEEANDVRDLQNFGSENKTQIKLIEKVFKDENPRTWGQAYEEGVQPPDYLMYYNSPEYAKDPVNLIYNVGSLPEGSKISWSTPLEFDENGNLLTGNPTIKIEYTDPNREPDYLQLNNFDRDTFFGMNMAAIPNWDEEVDGNTEINPVDLIKNKDEYARAALESYYQEEPTDAELAKLKEYLFDPRRWSWDIHPDLSKPGYKIGFAQFTPLSNDDSEYAELVKGMANVCCPLGVRIRVKPAKPEKPDKPKEEKPKKPDEPKPQEPEEPKSDEPKPTEPEHPKEDKPEEPKPDTPHSSEIDKSEKTETKTEKTVSSTKKEPVQIRKSNIHNAQQQRAALPQTGAKQGMIAILIGLTSLAAGALFLRKSRRN